MASDPNTAGFYEVYSETVRGLEQRMRSLEEAVTQTKTSISHIERLRCTVNEQHLATVSADVSSSVRSLGVVEDRIKALLHVTQEMQQTLRTLSESAAIQGNTEKSVNDSVGHINDELRSLGAQRQAAEAMGARVSVLESGTRSLTATVDTLRTDLKKLIIGVVLAVMSTFVSVAVNIVVTKFKEEAHPATTAPAIPSPFAKPGSPSGGVP